MKREFIRSTLIKADEQTLKDEMKKDESLMKLLLTPAGKLPKNYTYLLAEVFAGWENTSLYHLMIETFKKIPSDQIYFSKAGDKIVGWCAYTVKQEPLYRYMYVDEIKMFSFDINRPNPVLLRDLETLINMLLDKYGVISWIAVKENPANRIYQKAIEKYNGSKSEYNNLIQYVIKR